MRGPLSRADFFKGNIARQRTFDSFHPFDTVQRLIHDDT
jgi:hypothetical protein